MASSPPEQAALSASPSLGSSPSAKAMTRRASDDESLTGDEINREEVMSANFDPATWIVCCGVLEKKRDGAWREGWAKRFFVLGKHALYYYITAKTDRTGYTPLLGEERGHIRLSDLTECKLLGNDKDYCFIQLAVKSVRKPPSASGLLMQNSVVQVNLRTPLDSGQRWYEALRASCNNNALASTTSAHSLSSPSLKKSTKKPTPTVVGPLTTIKSSTNVLSLTSLEEAFPLAEPVPVAPFVLCIALIPVALPYAGQVHPLLASLLPAVLVILTFLAFKRKEMQFNSLMRDARLRLSLANKAVEEANNRVKEACLDSVIDLDEDEEGNNNQLPKLHRAGSSLRLNESAQPGQDFMTWSASDHRAFKLRVGPNYKKLGNKAPSLEPMYSIVGVDLLKTTDASRLSNIMSHARMHTASSLFSYDDVESYQKAGVPKYFVINAQIPNNSPPMFGDDKADVGYSLILYFECKKELLHSILKCEPPLPPAVRLLQDYCRDHAKNPDIRRRFKAMGMADNLKDVGIPGVSALIEKFQGKPAIINKVAEIYESKTPMAWFEVDISIFDFPFVAKRALFALKDRTSEIRIRAGFTLQGETDEELPECLLGAVDICGLDFRLAKPM